MARSFKRKSFTVRMIETEADIAEGTRRLAKACPHMKRAVKLVGPPPLRRTEGGFAGLARIIVSQQLSTASASAIFGRFAVAVDPLTPDGVLGCPEVVLRQCGLSAGKVATLRAVSAALTAGTLDLSRDEAMAEEELRAQLMAVRGVGPWTADIYLMFCRGDADAFAAGDLALQIAAQRLMGLEERPAPADLLELAEVWRPWRGVAARLLWSYYAVSKPAKAPI